MWRQPGYKKFYFKTENQLLPNEIVVADSGYNDSKFEKNPTLFGHTLSARIRARHETCNKRLKTFNCLTPGFRHNIKEKHGLCFHAVAVILKKIELRLF